MKKPLVLLIDDEPSVLEALESTIRPAFESMFRVEAFDDPTDVANLTSTWEQEERAVALALVDQKMPGQSGVELLKTLRRSPCARHMRAIMLTGYAGLDSAIAAKNEAGVDRYLEKPWDDRDLHRQLAVLLRRFVTESGLGRHYRFREVTEIGEVREHLRLRFAIYRDTPGAHLLPKDTEIDLDSYDAAARFLSLFWEGTDEPAMVGTLRLASAEESPVLPVLDRIAVEDPALAERLHGERPEPLPLMTHLVDREAVATFHEALVRRGERVYEPGRFTVAPGHRSTSGVALGPVPVARYVIESGAAFSFFLHRFDHAILTCVPAHTRFYRPLGFAEVEGTRSCYQPLLQVEGTCLHAARETIPGPIRDRLDCMTTRLARDGATCLCPTFPACVPGPYASGSFRDTDLFCPMEASRRLAESGQGEDP